MTKKTNFTRFPFEIRVQANSQNGLESDSNLLLSEIPVSTKTRLEKLIGKLDEQKMTEVISGINFLTSNKNP